MAGTMDILVREMTMEDYDQVYKLWTKISGFRIRSIDDSREGVERFLKRNPTTSVVAVQNGISLEISSADMTDVPAVSIMYVWKTATVIMELATKWYVQPSRPCRKRE